MKIAGMVKTSFLDYPGKVSCVLFTQGCNFDCFYCHNRSLIPCSGKELIPQEDVIYFLRERAALLDGVVISGGEPTLQHDLIPFAKQIKEMGLFVKLDSNGSNPDVIRSALDSGVFDYYAIDYKAQVFDYQSVCGENADVNKVLATIQLLDKRKADFEVRTTVYPQLTASDMCFMANQLPSVPRYVLNPYRKPLVYKPCDEERISEPPISSTQMQKMADSMKFWQKNVVC